MSDTLIDYEKSEEFKFLEAEREYEITKKFFDYFPDQEPEEPEVQKNFTMPKVNVGTFFNYDPFNQEINNDPRKS